MSWKITSDSTCDLSPELLERYENKRSELVRLRYQVTDTILNLRGRYQQEVLFKRYVELKRWNRIASEMNLSVSMTFNVHKAALETVAEILKDWSKVE